jgi:hypothetical protein
MIRVVYIPSLHQVFSIADVNEQRKDLKVSPLLDAGLFWGLTLTDSTLPDVGQCAHFIEPSEKGCGMPCWARVSYAVNMAKDEDMCWVHGMRAVELAAYRSIQSFDSSKEGKSLRQTLLEQIRQHEFINPYKDMRYSDARDNIMSRISIINEQVSILVQVAFTKSQVYIHIDADKANKEAKWYKCLDSVTSSDNDIQQMSDYCKSIKITRQCLRKIYIRIMEQRRLHDYLGRLVQIEINKYDVLGTYIIPRYTSGYTRLSVVPILDGPVLINYNDIKLMFCRHTKSEKMEEVEISETDVA